MCASISLRGLAKIRERPVVMISTIAPELDAALAELEKQGLTVRLHNAQKNTWHIAKGGLYSGYVVSDHELVYLGRAKKLSFQAIKNLTKQPSQDLPTR